MTRDRAQGVRNLSYGGHPPIRQARGVRDKEQRSSAEQEANAPGGEGPVPSPSATMKRYDGERSHRGDEISQARPRLEPDNQRHGRRYSLPGSGKALLNCSLPPAPHPGMHPEDAEFS